MPVLQKIYVILGEHDEGQLERLCQTLSSLFSHVNLTSNLYLVTESLPEGMPQVERILKEVSAFLRANLFARLYVHFVHRAPHGTEEEMNFYYQYYYQNCKRATREFDQQGYMHQELPRLMSLPLIVPDSRVEPSSLMSLLGLLKSAFLLPSLYLDWSTFFLAANEDLLAKTEKVYYGDGNGGASPDVVCNLCREEIFHDTSAKLEPDPVSLNDSCPAVLIISAQDGSVYPCLDAFLNKESLADIHGNLDVDMLMARYDEYADSQKGCLACRERVVKSFSDLPLPQGAKYEVSDLLYHFGTLHQEVEDHLQAVKRYEKALSLSRVEEEGPVHFRLALCYTKMGSYDQALESFNKAEPTYHDQSFFHFYSGLCCFEKGDYRAALERFSKAADRKPEYEDLVKILIYQGTSYNTLAEYEEALVPLERAKKMAGHVKEIHNALGFSYYQLKDHDKAIENLGIAVTLDPHSAIDFASLGANYREKGDTEMAITMFEKALALDPTIASARENLEKLKAIPRKVANCVFFGEQ